jgi:hypothetical protein
MQNAEVDITSSESTLAMLSSLDSRLQKLERPASSSPIKTTPAPGPRQLRIAVTWAVIIYFFGRWISNDVYSVANQNYYELVGFGGMIDRLGLLSALAYGWQQIGLTLLSAFSLSKSISTKNSSWAIASALALGALLISNNQQRELRHLHQVVASLP